MFYPFLVCDPHSGLHYRLNATRLAELSLAPLPLDWVPGRVIADAPDDVWAESLANAPVETTSAVVSALEDLIIATTDLRPPLIDVPLADRAGRHLAALVNLWKRMGEALPDGLAPVRHVFGLERGQFLDPLPVVAGSLDPFAPAAMRALHDRLRDEFGSVSKISRADASPQGTRLAEIRGGVARADVEPAPMDDSLAFYGLRDPASCADFAAARARALIKAGCSARDIAVMSAARPQQLVRAFAAQGVPLSGLPAGLPERDVIGETLLHLLLAKRPPTPAMVLASLALSPLMPWATQTGRDLAEALIDGDFRGAVLTADPDHTALWNDIRRSTSSLAQLRFLLDRICRQLPQGDALRARLAPLTALMAGDGAPDWEALIRSVQILPPTDGEPQRNLEGVSLWPTHESPWRSCRHLIVTDFSEGLYPTRPSANPLFLDSEIAEIRAKTGLSLRGRAEGLERNIALFNEQLAAVADSVTFLVPWRDLAGARQAPSTGLSLIARTISGLEEASNLIIDLSHVAPKDWPVARHTPMPVAPTPPFPETLAFPGVDLLSLRREDDGTAKPQSPSRLETLIVSPLAWLLGEMDASDMSWSAEELDVLAKGNIAHDVFEHVFPASEDLPNDEALREAVVQAYDRALSRHAGYLRSAIWEMERAGLEREIMDAALRWRDYLIKLDAKIVGNEIWLRGEAHGIKLHGKADAILQMPDGALLVVDHKKSGTNARRRRMEAGWDLQAGLYRDMIARPMRREGDGMDPLIGREVAIAYHLMNDGGLLTSGLAVTEGSPARDMGDVVNEGAIEHLVDRLAKLGAGRVPLNTTADEAFFKKEGGFTPYALTEGSPLVRHFVHEAEEE